MKVYISGKISGCDIEEAKIKFGKAAEYLTCLGHSPISPFDNGLPIDVDWTVHMTRDIEMLLECDAIFLLSDWQNSRGARIERNIAAECGLRIIPQQGLIMFPTGNFIYNKNSQYGRN